MSGTTLEGLGRATIDYEGAAFESQKTIGTYESAEEALQAAKAAYEKLPTMDRDNHVHVIAEDWGHQFHVIQLRENDFTDAQLGDLNVAGFRGRAWILDAEGQVGVVRTPEFSTSLGNITDYVQGTRPTVPNDQWVGAVQSDGSLSAGTYSAMNIKEPNAVGVLIGGGRRG